MILEMKNKYQWKKSRKAQEEIIGFGIILILIAVIAMIFISISINKNQKESVEDFEVSSFLKALMEKTTTCEKNAKLISVKDLIFECGRGYTCFNEENSYDVLNETIKESMQDNWPIVNGSTTKGYSILVYYESGLFVNETKGINYGEFKGAMQDYAKSGEFAEIYLKIYY